MSWFSPIRSCWRFICCIWYTARSGSTSGAVCISSNSFRFILGFVRLSSSGRILPQVGIHRTRRYHRLSIQLHSRRSSHTSHSPFRFILGLLYRNTVVVSLYLLKHIVVIAVKRYRQYESTQSVFMRTRGRIEQVFGRVWEWVGGRWREWVSY